jgi:hypothetical protein
VDFLHGDKVAASFPNVPNHRRAECPETKTTGQPGPEFLMGRLCRQPPKFTRTKRAQLFIGHNKVLSSSSSQQRPTTQTPRWFASWPPNHDCELLERPSFLLTSGVAVATTAYIRSGRWRARSPPLGGTVGWGLMTTIMPFEEHVNCQA